MVLERAGRQKHVLIISHDVVGAQMAGPGIRYYQLAQILAQEFKVVLAVPAGSSLESSQDFVVLSYHLDEVARSETGHSGGEGEQDSLEQAIQQARVVLVPAVWLARISSLSRSPVPLVIDGYDPVLSEVLSLQVSETTELHSALTQAYLAGDFFICASERQRDWWLGLLEGNGRVNPSTFRDDPSLRRLIDVVSFGLPGTLPQHTRQVVKGVWPGISEGDRVILWGGGLWQWLDPLTAIRAVGIVWQQRQDVRLVFPGTKHPNPQMARMPTHEEAARQAARELGLLNRAVFFGKWLPYADWPNVLLESDVALTLHYDTLETRLAFRSRVLDYVWAGLPIVTTRGDATSDLIARYELGIVVDYEDADGVAEAIFRLLETPREALSERFAEARRELTWDRVARPLVEFCRHPRQAADKAAMGKRPGSPYYVQEQERLAEEKAYWQDLARRYEQGRFMRFMRWVHRVSQTLHTQTR